MGNGQGYVKYLEKDEWIRGFQNFLSAAGEAYRTLKEEIDKAPKEDIDAWGLETGLEFSLSDPEALLFEAEWNGIGHVKVSFNSGKPLFKLYGFADGEYKNHKFKDAEGLYNYLETFRSDGTAVMFNTKKLLSDSKQNFRKSLDEIVERIISHKKDKINESIKSFDI